MSKPGGAAQAQRAYDLIALLVGREQGVTIREIAEHLGVTYRTAIRHLHYAEIAGLIDWHRGHGPVESTRARLLNARLRRCA